RCSRLASGRGHALRGCRRARPCFPPAGGAPSRGGHVGSGESSLAVGACGAGVVLGRGASAPAGAEGAGAPAGAAGSTPGAVKVLYQNGLAAANDGRWEQSYALLRAAWRRAPRWQIAGALGLTELELEKYRDAAEHLAFFRRATSDTTKLVAQTGVTREAAAK